MQNEIQLTDGSVVLRPYQLSDADRLYEAVRESLAELSVWLPWCHLGYSIEESRAWIESRAEVWAKGTQYDFTINDPRDGSFLGGCGLNQVNRVIAFANLGYWARTSRTRQGIATAAALVLARFGFNELKLRHIEIVAAANNIASQRVAQKIGAKREEILPGRITVHDRGYDAVTFSLTPAALTR
jgi:ribosomal-protein-serine acetyltransferase